MSSFPKDLQVVLAHDWLTGMRGGERVLDLLCRAFAGAPVCTLIHDPARVSAAINAHPITTSPLQRVPGIFKRYRWFLPVFPWCAEHFRLPPARLLISTSHCVAKGVKPPPGARHLCYCFTPMRYAWALYEDYFGTNPLKKAVYKPILHRLREWDRRASDRVDLFVAISRHVQERIRRFYDRDAVVVYPPVDTAFFQPDPAAEPGGFDLIVSALVPYKRIDLAVRAYNATGRPLRIVGTGTEYEMLRALARPNITFEGRLSDEEIRALYQRCRLLVFPGEEDFGIVPLEAQACGKPVVAYAKGGALETVVADATGVFFASQTAPALNAAIEQAASLRWEASRIRQHAERFGVDFFTNGLVECIKQCMS